MIKSEAMKEEAETVELQRLALFDWRNLYTFSGRSDGQNFFVYGIFLPMLLVGLAFLGGNVTIILVAIGLSIVVGFSAMARRGRDIGSTPANTIVTALVSSWLVSTLLEKTYFDLYLMSINLYVGIFLVNLISSFYLVYLVFSPTREVAPVTTNKYMKMIGYSLAGIVVLGIVLALVVPKLATH